MTIQPPAVQDRESAIEFIVWCVGILGLGFHPDTPFTEYVDDGNQPTFSLEEASQLEELAARAFDLCDHYQPGTA